MAITPDGDTLLVTEKATNRLTAYAIGALKFGASTGTFAVANMVPIPHTDAIMGSSIKSLTLGAAPKVTSFAVAHYLESITNVEAIADILVKIV